jgi:AMP deaminase
MDSPYALHLAVAALVGASFAAASAYYMHRKTLDQLLRFARDQRRRTRLLPDGGAHGYDLEDAEEDEGRHTPAHRDHDRRTMPIPPGLPPLHTGREGTHPPPPIP